MTPRRLLFLLGGLLVAINALSALWEIGAYRDAVERDTLRGFNNLTAVLAEQTARSLESASLVVQGAGREVSSDRVGDAAMRRQRFMARASGVQHIRALFHLDREGRVVASDFPGSEPGADFSDRDYFTKHRDSPVKTGFVSEPFFGRLTNRWAFAVTESLVDEGGQFAGVVGAIIDIDYLDRLYRSLDIGHDGFVSLVTRDSVLVTRVPARQEWFGRRIAPRGSSFAERVQRGGFSGWTRIDDGGDAPVLVSAAPVPGTSLVVAVGSSEDAVFAPWRTDTKREIARALLVSAAMLGLVGLASVALARREEADRVAREARRRAKADHARLEKRLLQGEKLEAVGRLASGIAHDFNGVLGGILGYGQLLGASLARGSREEQYAADLMAAANRGRSLVDQILAYSRADRAPRVPIEAGIVLGEALNGVRASFPERVRLREAISAEPLVVLADPTQLYQVVMNLCTNAIHAMGDAGELTVSLDAAQFDREVSFAHATLPPGSYVRVTVADTGTGMDEATLARIFEPFYTTREAGKGTGLGLWVVHGIVAACGGATNVSSRPGAGSTFEVYLPRVRAQ